MRSQGCPGRTGDTVPITGRMTRGTRLVASTAVPATSTAVPLTGTAGLLEIGTAVLPRTGTVLRLTGSPVLPPSGTAARILIGTGMRLPTTAGELGRISGAVREATSQGLSSVPVSTRIRVPISFPVPLRTSSMVAAAISSGIRGPNSSRIRGPNRLAGHEPTSSGTLASRADLTSLAGIRGINGSTTAKTCSRHIGRTSSVTSKLRVAGLVRPKTNDRRGARATRPHASRHPNLAASGTSAACLKRGRRHQGLPIPACPSGPSYRLTIAPAGRMGCLRRPMHAARSENATRIRFTSRQSPTPGRPSVMIRGRPRHYHSTATARRLTRA